MNCHNPSLCWLSCSFLWTCHPPLLLYLVSSSTHDCHSPSSHWMSLHFPPLPVSIWICSPVFHFLNRLSFPACTHTCSQFLSQNLYQCFVSNQCHNVCSCSSVCFPHVPATCVHFPVAFLPCLSFCLPLSALLSSIISLIKASSLYRPACMSAFGSTSPLLFCSYQQL